jgi:DNA-binding transcriptional LysR family regulator
VADLGPFDLLLAVARTGSLGQAARARGISQPAASTQIRRLERQLGITLIERSPRGSRLTASGELVAGWAAAAIDAAAALDAGIGMLRASHDAVLRVAASMTVAEYLLPAWLIPLRALDAGTTVTLTVGNSAEVAAAVTGGAAEIGFIESPDVPPGLRAREVGTDTLTVIVGSGHPWTRRRSGITAAELAGTPLVSREPGSGTRRFLEHALRAQAGLEPAPPLAELSSTTAIKSAVVAGIGPSVLSSLAVAAELAVGTLHEVRVAGLDLTRTLRAVAAAGRQLTGPAADLLTIAVRKPELSPAPRDERGELLDVPAGAQRGDRCLVRRTAAGNQLAQFDQVPLVPGRGDQEQHLGRCRSRIPERVGAAWRHVHEAARPAARHGGAASRLPFSPVGARPGRGFEGEQVKFAVDDVERFLSVLVHVRADVEPWLDDHLEHRPLAGELRADLERKRATLDRQARSRRQYKSVRHDVLSRSMRRWPVHHCFF